MKQFYARLYYNNQFFIYFFAMFNQNQKNIMGVNKRYRTLDITRIAMFYYFFFLFIQHLTLIARIILYFFVSFSIYTINLNDFPCSYLF